MAKLGKILIHQHYKYSKEHPTVSIVLFQRDESCVG